MNFVEQERGAGGDGRILITLWVLSIKDRFYTFKKTHYLKKACIISLLLRISESTLELVQSRLK